MGNAYVAMCVDAGIAAADAICCDALGEHAQGEAPYQGSRLSWLAIGEHRRRRHR